MGRKMCDLEFRVIICLFLFILAECLNPSRSIGVCSDHLLLRCGDILIIVD